MTALWIRQIFFIFFSDFNIRVILLKWQSSKSNNFQAFLKVDKLKHCMNFFLFGYISCSVVFQLLFYFFF